MDLAVASARRQEEVAAAQGSNERGVSASRPAASEGRPLLLCLCNEPLHRVAEQVLLAPVGTPGVRAMHAALVEVLTAERRPQQRLLEEAPHHLTAARQVARLKRCLTDIDYFRLWWHPLNQRAMLRTWQLLQRVRASGGDVRVWWPYGNGRFRGGPNRLTYTPLVQAAPFDTVAELNTAMEEYTHQHMHDPAFMWEERRSVLLKVGLFPAMPAPGVRAQRGSHALLCTAPPHAPCALPWRCQIAQFLRAYHLGSHRPPPLLRPPAPQPGEYAFGSTATLLEPDLPEDAAAAAHIRAKSRLSASIAGKRAPGESPIVAVDSTSTAGMRFLPQAPGQVSRSGAGLDPGSSFKPHASDLAGVVADDLFRDEPIDVRKQRSGARRGKTGKRRRRGRRKGQAKVGDSSPGPPHDGLRWQQRVGPGPSASSGADGESPPGGGSAAAYTTEADKDGGLLKRSLTVAAALLAPLRPEAHHEVTVEESAWWESNLNKHRRREVEQRRREEEKARSQELVVTWGEDSAARWAWIQFPWFAMCNVLRGACGARISEEEAERLLWGGQEQRMWEKIKCVRRLFSDTARRPPASPHLLPRRLRLGPWRSPCDRLAQ